MISKVILDFNDDLPPAIVKWDNEKEDFVIDLPKGITMSDLVDVIEEIVRITQWGEEVAL